MNRFWSWLKKTARKGQTTSEYVIILGLVALGSIAVILVFGNQIRELFRSGTHKMAGQETQVESYGDEADDASEVEGLDEAFSQD
jgi:Flp pilus assembly pilin Flp